MANKPQKRKNILNRKLWHFIEFSERLTELDELSCLMYDNICSCFTIISKSNEKLFIWDGKVYNTHFPNIKASI